MRSKRAGKFNLHKKHDDADIELGSKPGVEDQL